MKDILNRVKDAAEKVVADVSNSETVKKVGEAWNKMELEKELSEAKDKLVELSKQATSKVTGNDEYDRLRAAAKALYEAGHWTCPELDQYQSALLWEALRDAAGIPVGTETARQRNA